MSCGEAAREYVREGRIKEGLGVCKWRTYKASLPTRAVPRPTPRAQPYCIGIGLAVPVSYTVSGPNCYSEFLPLHPTRHARHWASPTAHVKTAIYSILLLAELGQLPAVFI